MLESLLVTIILGYAFSYIAVKAIGSLIDWECRRSHTPEKMKEWTDGLLDQGRTEYITILGHHPAETPEDREVQFREMDTPANRKRWQELKNKPQRETQPAHMESSRLY